MERKHIVWGALVWNHIMYLIIVLMVNVALEITGFSFALGLFYVLTTIGFTLSVLIFRYSKRNDVDQNRGIYLQGLPQSITLLALLMYILMAVV